MKLHKDVKEKWIDALRSGEYSQSQNTLRDKKGFCCLGVLCDLYQKETGNGEWVQTSRDTILFKTNGDYTSSGVPPEEILIWSGMVHEAELLDTDWRDEWVQVDGKTVITYNDKEHHHLNFEGIADKIEQYAEVI